VGKILMTQPLWAQLALQLADSSGSLGRWGLAGRQLLGVVRQRAVRRLATVELVAARVQQRLGADLVEQATAAPILVAVPAVAVVPVVAAAVPVAAVPAVLEPVAAVPAALVQAAAALVPVAVVRAARAAGAAARRP